MAFLASMFLQRELQTQNLLEYDARMRVGPCGGILYLLLQEDHDFVSGIKVEDIVAGTHFTPELDLLAVRQLGELVVSGTDYPKRYLYEDDMGVIQALPLYLKHRSLSTGSTPCAKLGVWAWPLQMIFQDHEST